MSQLMLEQQQSGLQVAAIVHQNAASFQAEQEHWRGCKIYNVKSYGQVAYAPVAPSFLFVLRKALAELQPDIVHIHMPNLSAFCLLFLGFSKKPTVKWVIHWHSDVVGAVPDLKIRLLYPFYRLLERALLNQAGSVICTSPDYLESSKPLMAYRDKCHVIPLGIAIPGDLMKQDAYLRPDDDILRLICIGRLTYYKGHVVLFEAIRQLSSQGRSIVLDVVGAGELESSLKYKVKHEGLENNIRFHGAVSEAEKYSLLRQSDLLCLPSVERTEAFGVVLLEAAAMGKPALVCKVPGSGMTYVVQKGITGLVAEPNSVESLVEALNWAAGHRVKLAKMGRAALKNLQDRFSLSSVVKLIDSIYAQTMK